jgi:hypothetical protein
MAPETMSTTSETAIFSRILEPEKPMLTPDSARQLLALDFTQADRDRMNVLACQGPHGVAVA